MTTLALLQNQWFKDPARWERLMSSPRRREYLRNALFYTCLTGKRLLAAGFDPDAIIWENVHPKIGSKPSDCFGVLQSHVNQIYHEVQPDIILRFGKVAQSCELPANFRFDYVIDGPHPAARHPTCLDELRQINARLIDICRAIHAAKGGGA